ncbi:hypothetical protein JCM18899A_51740 [Nocardioides sp. AN3]
MKRHWGTVQLPTTVVAQDDCIDPGIGQSFGIGHGLYTLDRNLSRPSIPSRALYYIAGDMADLKSCVDVWSSTNAATVRAAINAAEGVTL